MTFSKDSDAVLDYAIDWSEWLGKDTISTSTWLVPSGLTEVTSSKTDTVTTIWLSGGTPGRAYNVTNRIATAGGRTDDRSLRIRVEQR